MIFNENNQITVFFESGSFSFSKNMSDEKMKELETRLKDEIDVVADLSKELKDENLDFDTRRKKTKNTIEKLKKISKVLKVVGTALPLATIPLTISRLFATLMEMITGILLLIIAGFGIIRSIGKSNSKKADKLDNTIINSYESDANKILDILNDMSKLNINEETKSKIKDAMEKVKSTIDEINDYKKEN